MFQSRSSGALMSPEALGQPLIPATKSWVTPRTTSFTSMPVERIPTCPSFADPGPEIAEDYRTGTIPSGIFNLCNTILGGTVIAMPFAVHKLGLVVFALLLGGIAIMANYTMYLLFLTTDMLSEYLPPVISYPVLGRELYGRVGEQIASWAVTLQQLGACIAYIVIVGDVLVPVIEQAVPVIEGPHTRLAVQILLASCVIFPLCLMRKMDSLKFASLVSLAFILIFILTVVSTSAFYLQHPESKILKPPKGEFQIQPMGFLGVLEQVPIVCFAFLCHQNAFPIYRELHNPSITKMSFISTTSMVICGLAYFLAGVMGYAVFLDDTQGDLLKNYRTSGSPISALMDTVRMCFGLSFTLSYPLIVFEARHNLDDLLFGGTHATWWRNFWLNLAIVCTTVLVGVTMSDIQVVFGFVGATCSPTMVFILPTAFFLKAEPGPWTKPNKIAALLLLLFGVALIPLCLMAWGMSLKK